jgi:hypothetical protein
MDDKMKKKDHIVRTVPKSNRENPSNRGKIVAPTNTHVHDSSLSWLGTDFNKK